MGMWVRRGSTVILCHAQLGWRLYKYLNKNIIFLVSFQKPLNFGIDIVMHSCTKYLGGHCDIIVGSLATSNDVIFEKLKNVQRYRGAVPSPFDCFLLSRSLRTLKVSFIIYQIFPLFDEKENTLRALLILANCRLPNTEYFLRIIPLRINLCLIWYGFIQLIYFYNTKYLRIHFTSEGKEGRSEEKEGVSDCGIRASYPHRRKFAIFALRD